MILRTHQHIFTHLGTLSLYRREDLALDVPTTAVDVVAWNSSEYLTLLNDGTKPFISLQLLGKADAPYSRPQAPGQRRWAHLDGDTTQAREADHPQPRDLLYQLDIRSPHNLWLWMIEDELERQLSGKNKDRIWDFDLTSDYLGPDVSPVDIPVRVILGEATRVDDPVDEVQTRYHRSVLRMVVHTWLLPRSSEARLLDTVQTVDITVDHEDESILSAYTIPSS